MSETWLFIPRIEFETLDDLEPSVRKAVLLKVSKIYLVRIDRNQYSVPVQWVGQVVSVRLAADQLDIVAQGKTIATHQRSFLRDRFICNLWHYLSVLEKKPGAIRHDAPFQNWELPEAIRRVREKLQQQDKNERAFVDLLLLTRMLQISCMGNFL